MKLDSRAIRSVVADVKAGRKPKLGDTDPSDIFAKAVAQEKASDQLSGKKLAQLKQTVAVVTGGILLAGIVFGVLMPTAMAINDDRQKIQTGEKLKADLEEKLQKLSTAQAQYIAMSEDIGIIDEAIGEYSDVSGALRIIGKLVSEIIAADGVMIIDSIDVDPIPTDNEHTAENNTAFLGEQEIIIEVDLVGNYAAIKEFITKIKGVRHNFRIEQITLANASSASNLLAANIYLKYYYYN